MAEVLDVEKREQVGSSATERLRRSGRVPAVLYGHGEGNEHLSVPAAQVKTLLRHHSKTVELAGDLKETALVSEVQWDPLGIEVLHLDLIRVNLKELVQVTVAVHRHGDAEGLRQGGLLIDNAHEVEIECSAGQIPENLSLNVTDLALGGHKTAGDLELPEGVSLITPADTVLTHIEQPKGASEETADALTEPEVISKGGDKSEGEG
ncbi:MAG TPA: 50S ribosomal protein L25 [Rhodopirellula sp.]|nr:50S ribosomal protein L25 [Rhodopirellula sp.]